MEIREGATFSVRHTVTEKDTASAHRSGGLEVYATPAMVALMEESAYMLAMTYFNQGDYISASHYFNVYYTTYPRGTYTELARFFCGKSLYLDTPEPRLDQTSTYKAIDELQMFIEYFPTSSRKDLAQNMIYELQDKLVEKEYLSAKLYYDLGSYTGNTSYSSTGNNYLAAVVTAQNVLRDYPYTKRREDLSILILRAALAFATTVMRYVSPLVNFNLS